MPWEKFPGHILFFDRQGDAFIERIDGGRALLHFNLLSNIYSYRRNIFSLTKIELNKK
jgi:hypothetical protein